MRATAKLSKREARWGLLFISPWVLGFLLFYAVPMIASLGFTAMDFNPSNPDKASFVGLENWKRAFTEDTEVLHGVTRIFSFTAISLPMNLCLSFGLALLLNNRLLFGKRAFRTLFYLPTMIPLVATAVIWQGFLNEYTGWLDLGIEAITGLKATGMNGLRWLANPGLVYWAYALIGIWGIGNTILIFMAGLQGVPTELYEAAEIDGATSLKRLRHITIPMVTPIILYNLTVGLIGMMQYFLVPWVINIGSGFPKGMTNFISVYFFRQSFDYFNMGYGAVIAWIIFAIALMITAVLFGTSRKWVYYASERG